MKTYRIAILPLAAAALAVSGCGAGGGSLGSGDVAKVGSVTITQAQFNQLMHQAKLSYQAQHQKFPPQTSPQYQQLKTQAVQFLVQRAQYSQAAKQLGINISSQRIHKRLQQIAKEYHGMAKLNATLKKDKITKATVESQIKNQLLQEDLYKKVTAKVTVSPKEVKAQYEQQYKPTRVVRHILLKSHTLASRLYKHLKADHGRDFATLAKKYSKDPSSATQGGKLTISKGQTVFQFDQTAFMLGTGTISVPIHTQYGWHIIQPLSKVKPPTPFKQVKPLVEQQLLSQKKQQVMQNWVANLSKKYKPVYQKGFAPPPTQTATTATTG